LFGGDFDRGALGALVLGAHSIVSDGLAVIMLPMLLRARQLRPALPSRPKHEAVAETELWPKANHHCYLKLILVK
jgi:hypothetical protein